MTVSVDPHMCEAHALCTEIAPEIFTLSDDDDIATCDEHPSEALLPKVRAAVDACPRQAISFGTEQS
ncbi:ferredoxin [Rhodococcus sp. SJ-3]|uniref:ferredoxin n=1 Tax=Rhodococcus sp. SJ-3 TaxID=3454628 RepID=UPI003F7B2F7D